MEINVDREVLISLGAGGYQADKLMEAIEGGNDAEDAFYFWQQLTLEVLSPEIPFAVHEYLFDLIEAQWDSSQGPMPAWSPSVARQQCSNIAGLMAELQLDTYQDLHRFSADHREDWWRLMVEKLGIVFQQESETVLDLSGGVTQPKWLPGAKMNIADSCFQVHGESVAMVVRKSADAPLTYITYDELDCRVNQVANGLVEHGFKPGDTIAIDMIMNAESVMIYLGIVKAGCVVISIADSFTAPEIETRLRIGKAAGIFTMDYLRRGSKRLPMYDKVTQADAPRAIVLPLDDQLDISLREGDLAWSDFLSSNQVFDSVPRDSQDIMNILFSSGTTGDPKAITWNHTTPIKGAADAFCHHDIQEGDVVCWPTNLGWMMGPWVLFAALINKGILALYEEAPTTPGFCRFVADAGVNMLGVVPSIVKAWRKTDATEDVDWSEIKAFSSTGECSAPHDMLYLMSRAGYQPVIEYIGGTEIGGGYAVGNVVQPTIPSTFSGPALGMDVLLLDEEGKPSDRGELFVVPPSIGLSLTLLNKDHDAIYHQGTPPGPNGEQLRRHGDQLERLANGYLRAQGRADDTMNLGGIKVSSAEIERSLKDVPGVHETAAIAAPPPDGGPSLLVIYAVVAEDTELENLTAAMRAAIKTNLNPLFKIQEVVPIETLPRTASGKVMRRVLRDQYVSSK